MNVHSTSFLCLANEITTQLRHCRLKLKFGGAGARSTARSYSIGGRQRGPSGMAMLADSETTTYSFQAPARREQN